MKALKDKILSEGIVIGEEILKVDSFLNHQMDVALLNQVGETFYDRFKSDNITKIVTIEASGIGIAALAAIHFKVPVVFAKKSESRIMADDVYTSEVYSFTKDKSYNVRVSKKYISEADTVLIIDDFLANGHAALGLADICEAAGAKVAGVGIVIEKGFQEGGKRIRERGLRLESLAVVDRFVDGKITFMNGSL